MKVLVRDNFVVYLLNYSTETKNLVYLARLGFPQRFGFPVLVEMDAGGRRLHIKDSSLQEQGKGYAGEK